jgi:hypothetical protein
MVVLEPVRRTGGVPAQPQDLVLPIEQFRCSAAYFAALQHVFLLQVYLLFIFLN